MTDSSVRAAVQQTVREEWGRVLATLVRSTGDLELAEDVLQEALLSALERWPKDGIPNAPRAWLISVARRRAIDRFRRGATHNAKHEELAVIARLEQEAAGALDDDGHIPDERLRLVFTCCHPALAPPAQVALTLRTLCGLSTPEIARAFLTTETTMAQRLVRAKRKIKATRIPYRVPDPDLWPERLEAVLSVVYLIFNEGYAATTGDALTRSDLCGEAIRLAQILYHLVPQEPEIPGLLALMLLHDSRREARTDSDGNLVTLERQDRAAWSAEKIAAARAYRELARQLNRPGPYQIHAAISDTHAAAPRFEATDWPRIVALYEALFSFQPTPVVALNRAVAISFGRSAEHALAELAQLKGLDAYQPFHAARADILRRAGRFEDARVAYGDAIAMSTNVAERRFLESQRDELPAALT